MEDFQLFLRDWQVFYATLATACATLIGLLFVVFTFRAESTGAKRNPLFPRILRKAFGDFLMVFCASLVFLVPRLSSAGLAIALLVQGIAWTGSTTLHLILVSRKKPASVSWWYLLRMYGLSLLGALGLVVVAVALFMGYTYSLYSLVGVLAALLASASLTAWLFLTRPSPSRGSGKR
jgi:hypothetical protein